MPNCPNVPTGSRSRYGGPYDCSAMTKLIRRCVCEHERDSKMAFTQSDLHQLIEEKMKGYRFVVVANREPFIHKHAGNGRKGGSAGQRHGVGTPPGHAGLRRNLGGPRQRRRRSRGGRRERSRPSPAGRPALHPPQGLAQPRAGRGLLLRPRQRRSLAALPHHLHAPPLRAARLGAYREVNQLFADAVLEEVGTEPAFVFVQDFHFCLLPRMLKNKHPRLIIAQFWHIPWPNREVFRTFPWGEELLDGLLGNDLLGFHVHYHCQNFLETVDREIEARVDDDRNEVHRGGHATLVRPYPISIDFEAHDQKARSREVEAAMKHWRQELNIKDEDLIGVGIERLDYTKGIPDRLRGIEYLLESHPEYRGRARFIQVAVPSRIHVPAYQQIDREVDETVAAINANWGAEGWEPITYIKQHQGPVEMMALHRLARFCVVSSLHDGMNLVAKEFVASRHDEDGVLILSRFTGAARELVDGILINPFSIGEVAEAMHSALSMPEDERRRRMQRMRAQVEKNNIYRWAGRILSGLLAFDFPEGSDGA